jgi:hypothetical protein
MPNCNVERRANSNVTVRLRLQFDQKRNVQLVIISKIESFMMTRVLKMKMIYETKRDEVLGTSNSKSSSMLK